MKNKHKICEKELTWKPN